MSTKELTKNDIKQYIYIYIYMYVCMICMYVCISIYKNWNITFVVATLLIRYISVACHHFFKKYVYKRFL